MSGPSRHRTSLTVGANITDLQTRIAWMKAYRLMTPWERTKNEITLIGYIPDPRSHYDFELLFFIAFGHPELEHLPVHYVLRHWHSRVSDAVGRFEKVALANRIR